MQACQNGRHTTTLVAPQLFLRQALQNAEDMIALFIQKSQQQLSL
jgi:hypothetical protein